MVEELPSDIPELDGSNDPSSQASRIVSMLLENLAVPLGMSISQFCESIGVSVRTYYSLPPDERPPEVRIGRRVIIRPEAGREWLRQREHLSMK